MIPESPDVGKCNQKQKYWYFNPQSGMCEDFMFSGCGGNRNRFTSSDECYRHCGVSKYFSLCCIFLTLQIFSYD